VVPLTTKPRCKRTRGLAYQRGAIGSQRQARRIAREPPGMPGLGRAAQRAGRHGALKGRPLRCSQVCGVHLQLAAVGLCLGNHNTCLALACSRYKNKSQELLPEVQHGIAVVGLRQACPRYAYG